MASLLRVADKKDAKLRVNGPVSYQVEEVSLQGVRPVATQEFRGRIKGSPDCSSDSRHPDKPLPSSALCQAHCSELCSAYLASQSSLKSLMAAILVDPSGCTWKQVWLYLNIIKVL